MLCCKFADVGINEILINEIQIYLMSLLKRAKNQVRILNNHGILIGNKDKR